MAATPAIKRKYKIQLVALCLVYCIAASAQSVYSQRISRLWWNEFKTTNGTNGKTSYQTYRNSAVPETVPQTVVSAAVTPIAESSAVAAVADQSPAVVSNVDNMEMSDTSSITDDELLSEASRLNAKMVRVVRKPSSASAASKASSKFLRRATQFDDSAEQDVFQDQAPTSSAAASNQFMRRSGRLFQDDNPRDNGNDRIWNYFENRMNGNRNSGGFQFRDTRASSNSDRFNSRAPNNDADDFITRQFSKRQNGGRSSSSSAGASLSSAKKQSTSSQGNTDNRVVNFNFNRKKNTEEKEQWRQLIQSIFDSSPRSTQTSYPGARVMSKSKFSDLPYTYGSTKPKVRGEQDNSLDSGKARADNDDDVLKGEREENVELNDKLSAEEEEEENDSTAQPELPPVDEEDSNEEDQATDGGNRKRQAPAEIAQEDEEEEPEDDQIEEDNQYLRGEQNQTVANIGNGSAKRSAPTSGAGGDSFGARINRSNVTALSPGRQKPKFTMHFQLGKGTTTTDSGITDQMITALENDPAFSGGSTGSTPNYASVTTTSSPFELPSTERFDELNSSKEDDDDLFERSQPVNRDAVITTKAVVTTTEAPKRTTSGGKPRTGKWMDSETFQLNDDRSMIMLPEDEEEEPDFRDDEEEPSANDVILPNKNAPSARRNRMAANSITPSPPPQITKRKLTAGPQSRTVRQDDLTGSDDISRLAAALPGTPGQDYPIFGSIPRTSFNCRDHKWPGYYADSETQCQVFHICQSGGRKNSFLCPNGTMFNQQLFICDWWHNVQCDQVSTHYELNANIYDYQWESKRSQKTNPKRSVGEALEIDNELSKRIGETRMNDTAADLIATTTVSPISDTIDSVESVTTTESSNPLFTETVFGARSKDDSSEEPDQKKKRATSSVSGVKGGKLVKFNRINSLSSGNAKSAKSSSGTTAAFFSRYKYASHQQLQQAQQNTPKPSKVASTSRFHSSPAASSSLTSTFRSRNQLTSSSSSPSPSAHLPFTSHLSSSSLHRSKHHRA